MTECSIVILILFYYYLIHVKVIIESAFDSLLRLFILQRTDSVSMHHDSHATEGIYSSLTAMIFNSLWTMYNLNLNLEATRGVWDVFGKCQCLEVLWLSDKVAGGLLWLMHGGDVMEEAFRVLFGTAVACSDNPQSNLTNWKEYTHSLFSLIRQQTAPEYLLQTSQMNELDSVNSGCRGQIFSDECCTNAKLKWIRWEIGCQRCCVSRIFCSKYLPNSLHLFWCLIGFDREVYAVCSQQFTVVSWYTDGIGFSWPQVGKNVDGINYTTRCALSVYHVQHGTNQAIRNHCISEALFIQS